MNRGCLLGRDKQKTQILVVVDWRSDRRRLVKKYTLAREVRKGKKWINNNSLQIEYVFFLNVQTIKIWGKKIEI